MCFVFSCSSFFCFQYWRVLIYSRLELKFSFSLKGFLEKATRPQLSKASLLKCASHSRCIPPFFRLLNEHASSSNLARQHLFIQISLRYLGLRRTYTVCTLTGVVPVAKKTRYGHELGLEMRRTPSL